MTSILTNASAMVALQALTATNKAMSVTQSRISTGLRVAEAADNAAYWSIATTMRSDNKAISAVQDALGLGASRVDTAYTAMDQAIKVVDEIKQKLVAAIGASDSDKAKLQTDIEQFKSQLVSIADSATFSGANWLSVDTSDHSPVGTHEGAQIVASFNRSADGSASLGMISIDVQSIKLYDAATGATVTNETMGILQGLRSATTGLRDDDATAAAAGTIAATDGYAVATLNIIGFNDEQMQQMLQVVDQTLAELADAATVLGAAKKRVDIQKSFTTTLMDSIERGVGQLVDADMEKESTRLQALQVQQQLGIQALQIANTNPQNILTLFRS